MQPWPRHSGAKIRCPLGCGAHPCIFIKWPLLVFAFLLTQWEILYCKFEDNSWQQASLFCLLSLYFLLICFLLFPCGYAHCCHTAGEEKWGFFVPMLGRSLIPQSCSKKTGVLSLIFTISTDLLMNYILLCLWEWIFLLI